MALDLVPIQVPNLYSLWRVCGVIILEYKKSHVALSEALQGWYDHTCTVPRPHMSSSDDTIPHEYRPKPERNNREKAA